MWLKDLYKSYKQDTGGNFAMMFGLLSVPILIAVGMTIDISRAQSAKKSLQNAVDTAVLQASVLTGDQQELELKAREIFNANLNYTDFEVTDFQLTEDEEGNVSISARGNIPAMFAQINGYPKLNLAIGSSAEADSNGDLEMVIAFDTTNSMGFDNTWDQALLTLDTVLDEIEEYSGSDNFFVSLVPFSDRVNVGTGRDGWLDSAAPVNWNGCVEPRDEDNGEVTWALTDAKPTGSNRFDASIPGSTGGLAARGGGYPYCASTPIVAPTNDIEELITAAGTFSKSGTGRFDVGMAWAYRMVSDDWRGHWSAGGTPAANGRERRKIALLVTDGRTNAYDYEVNADNSWGYNEGSVEGFENMVNICDNMKADGMEIFMVRVNGNTHATAYMKDCASTEDQHYYEISDNATLEIAFEEVLKVVKSNVLLVE